MKYYTICNNTDYNFYFIMKETTIYVCCVTLFI